MIGESSFNYRSRDIAALIRKDLYEKFGARELAGYDMTVPNIMTMQAKVLEFPNPTVKVTSVAEQIQEMKLPFKPEVPRADTSVSRDAERTGGDEIVYSFDRPSNKLIIAGGPVKWSDGVSVSQSKPNHWVGVKVGWPLGINFEPGQIIPYSINGVPSFLAVDESAIESHAVVLYLDAAITTHNIIFNWDSQYSPETIKVVIQAALEDSAVRKIPAFPEEPRVEFTFPQAEQFCDAEIQVHVDLSVGK